MNNFDATKHKIAKLETEITENGIHYDELKKVSPKLKEISYIKHKTVYTLGTFSDITTSSGVEFAIQTYSISLKNFPVSILPFIKILPIISTKSKVNENLLGSFLTYESWQNEINTIFNCEVVDSKEQYTLNHGIKIKLYDRSNTCPIFKIDVTVKLYINIPRGYDEYKKE